jgi:hypothetical protein
MFSTKELHVKKKDFGMISYGKSINAHPIIYGVAMSRVREDESTRASLPS